MPQINWVAGWSMVLAAFVMGAGVGLFFGNDDFMGGYVSWRRRLARLGHIALVALGLVNVLFSVAPQTHVRAAWVTGSSIAWIVGGIAMPAVCFLSAWRKPFKALFFIPVGALVTAVVFILAGSI